MGEGACEVGLTEFGVIDAEVTPVVRVQLGDAALLASLRVTGEALFVAVMPVLAAALSDFGGSSIGFLLFEDLLSIG